MNIIEITLDITYLDGVVSNFNKIQSDVLPPVGSIITIEKFEKNNKNPQMIRLLVKSIHLISTPSSGTRFRNVYPINYIMAKCDELTMSQNA